MKTLVSWWPEAVWASWFVFIIAVAGMTTAFFAAVTGLAVCMIALYEAGTDKSRQPVETKANHTQGEG